MANIGTTIKLLRLESHVQQKELAKAIGVSQSWLSKIESDNAGINAEIVKKIAAYLGVPVQRFYEEPAEFINNRSLTSNTGWGNQPLQAEIEKLQHLLHHKNELLKKKDRLLLEYRRIILRLNGKAPRKNRGK